MRTVAMTAIGALAGAALTAASMALAAAAMLADTVTPVTHTAPSVSA